MDSMASVDMCISLKHSYCEISSIQLSGTLRVHSAGQMLMLATWALAQHQTSYHDTVKHLTLIAHCPLISSTAQKREFSLSRDKDMLLFLKHKMNVSVDVEVK